MRRRRSKKSINLKELMIVAIGILILAILVKNLIPLLIIVGVIYLAYVLIKQR